MKTIQKTSAFALLFFNLITGFRVDAQAIAAPPSQTQAVSTERIVRNYVHGLRSANHGVVESAIFNALQVAAYRPDANIRQLQREIARLEVNGHTPSIRYRSLLASYVLAHPQLLQELPPAQFESDIAYFQALTTHLGSKLLSDPAVAVK
jgi:hypothetical protein